MINDSRLNSTLSFTTPALTSLSPFFGTVTYSPSTDHCTSLAQAETSFEDRSSQLPRFLIEMREKHEAMDAAKRLRKDGMRWDCWGT